MAGLRRESPGDPSGDRADSPVEGPVETRWVEESVRLALREGRLFLATAWAVTVQPARFAAEWAWGDRRALNPLGYFATAAALVTLANSLVMRLLGRPGGSEPLLTQVLDSIGIYLHYVTLGLLCHAFLRWRGSIRTVRGSLAIALYVGGGPATIVHLFNVAMLAYVQRRYGKHEFTLAELTSPALLATAMVIVASRLAALVVFIRALTGFHALKTGWATLALVLAMLVTGLVFGLLDPPGQYGLHLVIGALGAHGRRIWTPAWAPF